ncbi:MULTISPECIES: YjzD family protein [Bacillaceae]|uniref:YjzD family protein n=1 Tax=Bacillaceae TaxID=186817 RepID=UPI001E601CB6|nr:MULTISPECIES: YjzD family protein [Bacillaceae]MCE4050455.1 YjzD family protein [Bacillus sp. Au-Bac7]MCM3030476.1 YjzD family protein [Niallia sp. MER 6]MDL0434600.1 YjzD family protein [Niallia sp. SS-2023]UPO88433.1 YjzD family protein [Niallia sp. Man26]
MRYIVTIFWTFLLAQMLTYVISSMNGITYSFSMGVVLTVVFSVVIFLLAAVLPNDEPSHEEGSH